MIIALVMMFGLLLTFAGTALYAFYWSARTGQFQNLEEASREIFDQEEPIGKATDAFPGETWTPKYRVPFPKKEALT